MYRLFSLSTNIAANILKEYEWLANNEYTVGAVVQLVQYRTRNREVAVRLTPGPLQATLSKLLTYCVLRLTQPPILSGTGNE